MLSIIGGAKTSSSLKLRISDYFDGEDTAAALKAQQDGPRVALAVATATNEHLIARVKELEANGARPPPRARDPPTDVSQPPVRSKWDKEKHRKCKNHPEKSKCVRERGAFRPRVPGKPMGHPRWKRRQRRQRRRQRRQRQRRQRRQTPCSARCRRRRAGSRTGAGRDAS